MKRFSLIAASFVLAALSAASGYGQGVPSQPAAGTFRIAVINSQAFDGKEGITRYTAAMNALETEFKPVETEIQGMATRYTTLGNELKKWQDDLAKNPQLPINKVDLQKKAEEYENLGRQIKFKQEDAKARFERRQPVVLGPIQQEIGKALQDYAKQKGYSMIFDATALDGARLVLAFDDKVDATKDFITFFNARPATTATTATPR